MANGVICLENSHRKKFWKCVSVAKFGSQSPSARICGVRISAFVSSALLNN